MELELVTVRDWLRYAVSRFSAAGLVYGHGTGNALDEAAYLILHTLHLPIDQLDPWLDARLLPDERAAVREIIETRIATRKPAPYLTNEAWIQGPFLLCRRAGHRAALLYRRIAVQEMAAPAGDGRWDSILTASSAVLDLCTGSGCLAILAALAFPECDDRRQRHLARTRLPSPSATSRDYGLEERISLLRSDLFAAHAGKRYDLILANPPYVSAEALAAFPPEYAAEPDRPCRRRRRARPRAPHPGRGGQPT